MTPRRGALRRHLRRARGEPRLPARQVIAALRGGRLRGDADRGRRRSARGASRRSTRGPTRCSTRCTAASARTARSRACSTGSAFPTRIPACAPRRWRWTRWRRRPCSRPPGCRCARGRVVDVAGARARRPDAAALRRQAGERRLLGRRRDHARAATTAAPRSRPSWRFGRAALVEEYVPGRELTVGVMGDRALAVTEIAPRARLLRLRGEIRRRRLAPRHPGARSIPTTYARALDVALAAHRALGCRGATPRRLPLRRHRGRTGAPRAAGGQHAARPDAHLAAARAGRASSAFAFPQLCAWMVENAACRA